LSIVETSTQTINQNEVSNTSVEPDTSVSKTEDIKDLTFNLGLWLSGLESFLNLQSNTKLTGSHGSYDWAKEFRITHSTLLLCSKLTLDIAQIVKEKETSNSITEDFELLNQADYLSLHFASEEVFELSFALKESILLSQGFLRATPLKFSEWAAWSNSLGKTLKNVGIVEELISQAENTGEEFLPRKLQTLLKDKSLPTSWESDLKLVLPRLAKTLKWLSVIGKMLKNDEPLKTTIVLFARINEQMQEMMSFINNRLLRFPNQGDELFSSMDSAAYTASIELRKVFKQELNGLTELRPTPLIYAKIETAYSLLNDSLQLTLVNFAQLIDYNIDPTDIFPNLQTKEEQSIELRKNMWDLLQHVKNAEKEVENFPLDSLHLNLNKFRDENLYFLFYKDMETVDRFIEEVLITDKKELVPILHRFGAYLETLLGQVNMRAVLANHPFEPLHKESHEMFV
jgi:hypothetical protein